MYSIKQIYKSVTKLIREIHTAHLGAFAAQGAFFLIMAFVPLLLLTISTMSLFEIDMASLLQAFSGISFHSANEIHDIFMSFSTHPKTLISFNTIFTAWSAGKAFYALAEGFHSVLGIRDERNYLILRIKGLLYSVFFAVVVSSVAVIGVFGEWIITLPLKTFSVGLKTETVVGSLRRIYVFFSVMLVMILVYRYLPDWDTAIKSKKLSQKPKITHILGICAIFTVFIYVFTVVFSIYVVKFSSFNVIYGGLAALIAIMLWLYISMYALLVGFRFMIIGSGSGGKFKIQCL